MTAALQMGGFKIENLANGTASTDAATYGQLLWKPVQVVDVTSDVASFEFTWPTDAKAVRVTGKYRSSLSGAGAANALIARLSYDGSTFKSGATDYNRGHLVQSGSTVAGTGNTDQAFLTLSNTNESANFDMIVDCLFSQGSTTPARRPSSLSHSSSWSATNFNGTMTAVGYCYFTGEVQKVRILPFSGNIVAGSRFLIEAF